MRTEESEDIIEVPFKQRMFSKVRQGEHLTEEEKHKLEEEETEESME